MRKLLAYYAIWFSGLAIWGFVTYWLFILVHSWGVPYGGPVGLVSSIIELVAAGPFIWWLIDR